jgi:hypothetical protein
MGRNTETQAYDGSDIEDAFLEALLRYSASFYGAAIDHGMKASDTVHAMQHIEQAARGMHKTCKALRNKLATEEVQP